MLRIVQPTKNRIAVVSGSDGLKDGHVQPDLVFMDLNMPITPGQECLRKVIQHKFRKKVPVIVYSTASREKIVEECYEIGASMYVVKPSDVNKLKDTISEVIKRFIADGN